MWILVADPGVWGRRARTGCAGARALGVAFAALALLLAAPSALAKRRAHHLRWGPSVGVTLTKANLGVKLEPMRSVRFSSARTYARTLTVNPSVAYQRMIGFGGAMTDSSAWLLYDELSPEQRAVAMRALFSSGARRLGLNFVRVPMGASDFSAGGAPYTYDDLPPGQTDPTLANFSIAHDEAYIIPALQQMLAIDPAVYLLATEWSAPAWMKANGSSGNIGFQGTPLPAYYGTLALYFTKFIQAYKEQGIPIWAITPQNEPDSPAGYPAMTFTSAGEAQFVTQNLAPTLAAANLDPLVFGMDDTHLPFADQLMQTTAARALSGIAWHCYGGQQVMSQFHAEYPTEINLLSECSPGIIPYGAAEAAIDGSRNWASAINLWNLALDPSGGPVQPPNGGCHGCSGLLTVSESSHTFVYNRNFYELGQLSRFVKPGAVRIDTQRWVSDFTAKRPNGNTAYGVTKGLDNVAFRNPDGGYVLICHENSEAPVTFGVQANGLRFKYTLPGEATATFTWHGRA